MQRPSCQSGAFHSQRIHVVQVRPPDGSARHSVKLAGVAGRSHFFRIAHPLHMLSLGADPPSRE